MTRSPTNCSTWSSTRPRRDWPTNHRLYQKKFWVRASSPTTWCTAARRRFSPPRAAPGRARATVWACWSSRRRNPFSSGAGCVRTRIRCLRSCVAFRPFRRFRSLVLAWKAFCYTLGAAVLAIVGVQLWFFGHIVYWSEFNPSSSAFMRQRLEVMRAANPAAKLKHHWIRYERISEHLKRAVVAAEDARFLDHEGFDWEAIQIAMQKNEKRGKVVAGASTISQQLAKNLFLSGERSWLRKGQEAMITWMMERTLSKRRILELYLNLAEWGEGVFGAEAAARHHFGLPAAALGPEQAAWLAAILPSPRRYDRGRETAYLAGRIATISTRMTGAQIP